TGGATHPAIRGFIVAEVVVWHPSHAPARADQVLKVAEGKVSGRDELRAKCLGPPAIVVHGDWPALRTRDIRCRRGWQSVCVKADIRTFPEQESRSAETHYAAADDGARPPGDITS